MLKNLHIVVYICCLLSSNFAEKIVEFGDHTFVQHRGTTINVFKENVFESKFFEFDESTFGIPYPDFMKISNNSYIDKEAKNYAYPLLEQTNDIIFDSYKTICTNDFEGGHDREKRFIFATALAITGVFAFASFVMNIKGDDQVEILKIELKKTQDHVIKLTEALNSQRQQLKNEQYLSNLKNEFNAYIYRTQKAILLFIKRLISGKTIKLSDIPDHIKVHLSKHGISENAEKFYSLRIKNCNVESVIVEIKSAEAKIHESIVCHKYTNLGYFSNNYGVYNQYILPHLYCYKNGNDCAQVDSKNCIQHHKEYNCTNTAMQPCLCHIHDTERCKIKTEHAIKNFLHFEEYQDFTTFATTYKAYSIIQPTNTISKNVPPSGIFTTVINEADSLKIGDFTIRGKSFKPTYIGSIVNEKFVAPEIPTVENITHNFSSLDLKSYNPSLEFLIGAGIVGGIMVLLLLIVFSCFVYKKCCKNGERRGGEYGKLNLIVNQNKV